MNLSDGSLRMSQHRLLAIRATSIRLPPPSTIRPRLPSALIRPPIQPQLLPAFSNQFPTSSMLNHRQEFSGFDAFRGAAFINNDTPLPTASLSDASPTNESEDWIGSQFGDQESEHFEESNE